MGLGRFVERKNLVNHRFNTAVGDHRPDFFHQLAGNVGFSGCRL